MLIKPITHSALFLSPFPGPLRHSEDPFFSFDGQGVQGRDPFNQNSNRSDREKRTTSKGGPVFPKLFRLDRTDPLSFGPKFPESLVEWIAPQGYRSGIRKSSLQFA